MSYPLKPQTKAFFFDRRSLADEIISHVLSKLSPDHPVNNRLIKWDIDHNLLEDTERLTIYFGEATLCAVLPSKNKLEIWSKYGGDQEWVVWRDETVEKLVAWLLLLKEK